LEVRRYSIAVERVRQIGQWGDKRGWGGQIIWDQTYIYHTVYCTYTVFSTVRLGRRGGGYEIRHDVYEKLTRPREGPPARAAGRPASARQETDGTQSQPDKRINYFITRACIQNKEMRERVNSMSRLISTVHKHNFAGLGEDILTYCELTPLVPISRIF
jgi:hypothetical protein